jgi:Tfp pilus assembly protein PilP
MMVRKSLLLMLIAASAAWAQAPAPAKAAPAKSATPAVKASARAVKPSDAKATQPKAGLGKKLRSAPKPKTVTPARKPSQPEVASAVGKTSGKRDPFVSPIVTRASAPGCATGKKCLVIDQIVLRGIVKAPAGIIAVVENAARKAYFLRENDPVFNGYVAKITGDSIVFKETVVDRLGHTSTRDVIKRVSAPAV